MSKPVTRSTQNGRRDTAKLNAAGEMASEILPAYKMEGFPYYRPDTDIAKIELKVEDPKFDHQSLATEITKLKSVQSFQGGLHLVFVYRGNQRASAPPRLWGSYDAKKGKRISHGIGSTTNAPSPCKAVNRSIHSRGN